MKSLTKQIRQNVFSLLESGCSYSEIVKATGVSKSSVHRIAKSRSSHVTNCPKGQPRKLSEQDRRKIICLITSGKCDTAVDVTKELCKGGERTINSKTVTNALKSEGFKSAAKVKKPMLSKKN